MFAALFKTLKQNIILFGDYRYEYEMNFQKKEVHLKLFSPISHLSSRNGKTLETFTSTQWPRPYLIWQ